MTLIINRNLKKSLNLTGYSIHSSGAFCSYFKYNDTQGIKVLYSDGYRSIKALRRSLLWRRATKESTLLKKCKERLLSKGFTSLNIPKTYGVHVIKVGKLYYPGIVMQHITGNTANCIPVENWDSVRDTINKQLRRKGIYHSDIHKGNVIWNDEENTWYVLDFTFDLVGLDGWPPEEGAT
jgi:RIO-like serine/threonine protein kinase